MTAKTRRTTCTLYINWFLIHILIVGSAVCRCQEALRLRLRDGRWGSEAPAPLTWRGISSHENWDWGLRPRVSHQTSPGEWPVIRITGDIRKLWCETRGEMQTVLWENVRKGLNKQLWKVHCTVRRSERLPKVKLVITSLIDEYRQVCFDFQVFENPMKTEECQNRLKEYFFPSSNSRIKGYLVICRGLRVECHKYWVNSDADTPKPIQILIQALK